MDAGERALLEQTVRDALGGADDASTDAVLSELGWLEMLASEPRDAVDVVFTGIGATNSSASVLDDVVVAALGVEPRPDLGVVLPAFATWAAPGPTGLSTARVDVATEMVVVTAEDDGAVRRRVAPANAVDARPVTGVDPDARLRTVRVDDDGVESAPIDAATWDAAVAAGRRALAHQVAGACRTMLDQARTHALDRVQFGRPVAHFQAVRHRLAEAFVAVEALEATLVAAWDEPGPTTAALAKASAGRAARTVGAHCQQVLAGIGFTTDHPFHRSLKRTMVLDGLLGSADDVTLDLGRRLLASRTVPTLVDL